jgi:hypothetical protein
MKQSPAIVNRSSAASAGKAYKTTGGRQECVKGHYIKLRQVTAGPLEPLEVRLRIGIFERGDECPRSLTRVSATCELLAEQGSLRSLRPDSRAFTIRTYQR